MILLLIAGVAAFLFLTHDPSPDFNADIKPIINKNCISCHGGVKQQAGFSLLFREDALSNTESGKPAIIPGDPEGSEMIRRLSLSDPEERMPYQHEPLAEDDIRLLRRWIRDGAKWGTHWAYTEVQDHQPPGSGTFLSGLFTRKKEWGLNSIDAFTLPAMEANNLTPAPRADKATLLRRVSLDIAGLPPTDTQRDEFLQSNAPDAYDRLIDSLLESQHFGERWASVWLDLARYSDTKGYERDDSRNIWEYRDWVIRAFNRDLPYDRFLIEQLAGDLIPGASDETLIATAFHRNTMTNDEGGTDNEEFRVAAVLDRVNTTWEALMGTTFSCVQCHSHPYDPFRHEDYYRFMAFFNNSRDEDTFDEYPVLRHFDSVNQAKLDDLNRWLGARGNKSDQDRILRFVKTWQPSVNSLTADEFTEAELYDTKWISFRNNGKARLKRINLTGKKELVFRFHGFVDKARFTIRAGSHTGQVIGSVSLPKTSELVIQSIPLRALDGTHDLYLSFSSSELKNPNAYGAIFDWFHFTEGFPGPGEKDYEKMKSTYEQLVRAKVPGTPIMMENDEDFRRETHVFERGNWLLKGDRVEAGVPAVLNPFPGNIAKNRLGLARWITSKKNPLTARTMVNRVWEQLFGTGIAETLEDLGTQGAAPTHRELLDHLSYKFMNEFGWSVKKLVRYIVSSATYQQDSRLNPEMLEKDPGNRYFARGSRVRLSAEQVRDQALMASGKLSLKMFGPGVMPYQPEGIWQSPYSNVSWTLSKGEDKYRRAVYTYWKRTAPYPSMITFDAASREVCATRRIRTNTPLQALVILNDEAYIDIAGHLAQRMRRSGNSLEDWINSGYQFLLFKTIEPDKSEVLKKLYAQAIETHKKSTPGMSSEETELAALTVVAGALLNLDEVLTKN